MILLTAQLSSVSIKMGNLFLICFTLGSTPMYLIVWKLTPAIRYASAPTKGKPQGQLSIPQCSIQNVWFYLQFLTLDVTALLFCYAPCLISCSWAFLEFHNGNIKCAKLKNDVRGTPSKMITRMNPCNQSIGKKTGKGTEAIRNQSQQ